MSIDAAYAIAPDPVKPARAPPPAITAAPPAIPKPPAAIDPPPNAASDADSHEYDATKLCQMLV